MSSRCCREFVSEVMATVGSRLSAVIVVCVQQGRHWPEPAIHWERQLSFR